MTPRCQPCTPETVSVPPGPPGLGDEWVPMPHGIDHDGHGLPDRDVGGAAKLGIEEYLTLPQLYSTLRRRLGLFQTGSARHVGCASCRVSAADYGYPEACSRNVIAGQAPRKPQQYLGVRACCQLPHLSQVELNP